MEENDKLEQAKALTDQLIKQAEKGIHTKFEFIKNFEMWWATKVVKKSVYKVAKIFKTEAITSYNKYIKQLENGIDNLQLLVNYRQSMNWADFYFEEVNIYDNMLYEFKAFTFCRPLTVLEMWLFGDQRREEDLVDYSGNNFKEELDFDEI